MWRLLPRNLKLVICKDCPALLCSSTIFIRTMYTVQYSAVSTYSVHDGTAWHYQTSVKSINQSGCPDTKTFCPRLAAQRSITPLLSLFYLRSTSLVKYPHLPPITTQRLYSLGITYMVTLLSQNTGQKCTVRKYLM